MATHGDPPQLLAQVSVAPHPASPLRKEPAAGAPHSMQQFVEGVTDSFNWPDCKRAFPLLLELSEGQACTADTQLPPASCNQEQARYAVLCP